MLRKVLVMNNVVDGKVQTKGLLSLEANNSLSGRLRVFDIEKENINLLVKIGQNTLVFDNISEPENFVFETVYHSLSMPICAVVTDGTKIFAYGKTEGFEGDYKDLIKELNDNTKDVEQNDLEKANPTDDMINEDTMVHKDNEHNSDDENDGYDGDDKNSEEKNNSNWNNDDSNYGYNKNLNDNFEIPSSQVQSRIKKSTNTLSEDIEDADTFFEMVQPQIDKLFSEAEHFTELEKLIENTEWVKVPYLSDDNDHYILGKILTDSGTSHICYGIPAENSSVAPPVNLEKYCQWLPLDVNNNESNGYWVMYQDAKTGENVEVV